MTGFSSHWLALREPIDHASRSMAVRNAMIAELRRRHGRTLSKLRVVDMGCGSGSNLRAIAPLLGREQSWRLLDYDPALLEAARHAISEWSDTIVSDTSEVLTVRKGTCEIHVEFVQADLNRDFSEWLDTSKIDLLTASALLDLVSEQWIEKFCGVLSCPLYAVLTYDGRMQWTPAHPLDSAITQAFNSHQLTDKGFGPAAGWKAVDLLEPLVIKRGGTVVKGDSTWHLSAKEASLHHQLLQGVAVAVGETGLLKAPDINDWLGSRLSVSNGAIGHIDIFVTPPEAAPE